MVVLAAGLSACNGNNPEQPQVDYDKMIGTWTLNSYTQKWVNTTDNIVELDSAVHKGTITIKKDKDEEGNMQYYYTDNFFSRYGDVYEGMIVIEKGRVNLYAKDGWTRKDMDNTYEFTVSFPADNKMDWSYEWTGVHTRGTEMHQDKRTANVAFTKQ